MQQIHISMRSTLAHIRQSRIAPSAITAPPPTFIPQTAGVGTPGVNSDLKDSTTIPSTTDPTASAPAATANTGAADTKKKDSAQARRGLQEERMHRDAWRGILDALTQLKEARDRERQADVTMTR